MAKKKDKEKTADSSSEQAKTGLTWQTVIVVAIIVIVIGGVRWWLSGSGSSPSNTRRPSSTASAGGAREIPRPARKATVTHKGAVGVFRSAQGDMRSMSGYWTASGMRVDLWCEAPGFCTWSPGGVELEASLLPEESDGRIIWTGVVHHPDEGWLKTEVKL